MHGRSTYWQQAHCVIETTLITNLIISFVSNPSCSLRIDSVFFFSFHCISRQLRVWTSLSNGERALLGPAVRVSYSEAGLNLCRLFILDFFPTGTAYGEGLGGGAGGGGGEGGGVGGLGHKVFFARGPLVFFTNVPIPEDGTVRKTLVRFQNF